MSNKSVACKAKKFKGFTNLFKNAKAKTARPVEVEPGAKKPFAGFTEAYKNFKPPQFDDYEDEDEDAASFVSPPVAPEPPKKVKVEYRHFVPTKYTDWRDERAEALQQKMQAGPPKADPEVASRSDSEGPPPFLGWRATRSGAAEPAYGAGSDRQLDDLLKTRLPSFRDLNEYPTKYQLRRINGRIKHHLAIIDEGVAPSATDSGSSYYRSEPVPEVSALDAHRRPLKEYLGKKVSYYRTHNVDLRRQRFDDWYSKFTFDYERKFKDLPHMPYTLQPEDYGSWYARVAEQIEHKYRDLPDSLSRQKIMETHAYLGDRRRSEPAIFDSSEPSLGGTMPSLSHCETCREI